MESNYSVPKVHKYVLIFTYECVLESDVLSEGRILNVLFLPGVLLYQVHSTPMSLSFTNAVFCLYSFATFLFSLKYANCRVLPTFISFSM